MNRRNFIKSASVLGLMSSGALRLFAQEPRRSLDPKLILSAPLTHSDWMLHSGVPWGAEGVRHMLDCCKQCGWSRIYWRAFDGGRALYRSKLMVPMGAWDFDSYWNPQSDADKALFHRYNPSVSEAQRKSLLEKFAKLDYSTFDPLAEAISYGHEIGLQIHAWLSINEDDHGWGLQSRFTREHPEFRWRRRDGRSYRSQLSFAFPEVRKYKLALINELLDQYPLDGLFVDWIRTGDVRDNPQNTATGAADYGYEEPVAKAFRKKFGSELTSTAPDDLRALALRMEPQTEFMRAVRKVCRKRKLPLAALVGHPWHYRGEGDEIGGNQRGLLLDIPTWCRESLVDSIVPAGYYRDGGNAELAWRALREESSGKAEVWFFSWVPKNTEEVKITAQLASKLGCRQILFWEADYAEGASPELTRSMRSLAPPLIK